MIVLIDDMDKFDTKILAVKRDLLFQGSLEFQGFVPSSHFDFETRILSEYELLRRGDIENDPSIKHPIAYAAIVNPHSREVFMYRRSKKGGEKRLSDMWSLGIGGHVEDKDDSGFNPILASLIRELSEEVILGGQFDLEKFGYINDDSNAVGKVHFGLAYLIHTDGSAASNSDEMASGEMVPIDSLRSRARYCEFETWSKLLIEPITERFRVR